MAPNDRSSDMKVTHSAQAAQAQQDRHFRITSKRKSQSQLHTRGPCDLRSDHALCWENAWPAHGLHFPPPSAPTNYITRRATGHRHSYSRRAAQSLPGLSALFSFPHTRLCLAGDRRQGHRRGFGDNYPPSSALVQSTYTAPGYPIQPHG
ncbi:hypothetical protein XELAEV_18045453mg [Xenopus laevis]|uniref:Uncharacterized protein n=1 Tax=Xenopus laevis TaxID=8355 RepID=A0A974C0F7_XENLA|nr:hypothetical protein XELAEV_18045453mg [Xenopus laevis]